MKFSIDYSPDDIYRAWRLYWSGTKQRYIVLGFGLAFLLILILFKGPWLSGLILLAMALFLLTYPFLYLRLYAHWVFKKNPQFKRTWNWTIEEGGISIEGPSAGGRMTWDHFIRTQSNNDTILLYIQHNLFNVIPKRVFSETDWKELIALVNRKMSA
jgi:hypothetical protein